DLTGVVHPRTEIIVQLLNELARCLRQLVAEPESHGRRFNDLCLQHGEMLTLYQGARATAGRCLGIAPDGGLLLETPSGTHAFYSGTLQPRQSAP
ncbi:MAG TPA: hypothetical protein VGH32_06365, partial [Pirellulales bacterium]